MTVTVAESEPSSAPIDETVRYGLVAGHAPVGGLLNFSQIGNGRIGAGVPAFAVWGDKPTKLAMSAGARTNALPRDEPVPATTISNLQFHKVAALEASQHLSNGAIELKTKRCTVSQSVQLTVPSRSGVCTQASVIVSIGHNAKRSQFTFVKNGDL